MLAACDQENLAFSHQHGATVKQQQQQQGQASRQLAPKTPAARYAKTPIKVPLNDENGAHTIKGQNENAMTSRVFKGGNKSNFVTPMAQRARAVLGDKTTNAKTKGLQTANGKSTAGELEKSQVRPRDMLRKLKEAQAETQKLQVHAQDTDSYSEDEIEYCPPKPKDLPYESDVLPDGVLTFDALKPENMMKGYHRYYFNPIDENGVSQHNRQLEEKTKQAIEATEKQVREDLESFDWGVKDELESDTKAVKKASSATTKQQPGARQPLATVRFKKAAKALSMDDGTKSVQRRLAKTSELGKPLHKQSPFAASSLRLRKQASSQRLLAPKRSSAKLDATSRTTIGYNRGRATASLLSKAKTSPRPRKETAASTSTSTATRKDTVPRSNTTLSNYSEKKTAPGSLATKRPASAAASAANAAAEDEEWKERVPFLSLFNPDDLHDDNGNDDEDDLLGIKSKKPDFIDDYENEEFELKLLD